jgi:hypothetical protein
MTINAPEVIAEFPALDLRHEEALIKKCVLDRPARHALG